MSNVPEHEKDWVYVICGPICATVHVIRTSQIVSETPPSLAKFRGQPFENIRKWADSHHWEYYEEIYGDFSKV